MTRLHAKVALDIDCDCA